MVIDAQAIEHLDILPPPSQRRRAVTDVDGSLFTFLSKDIRSPFGKRTMKRWVVSPPQQVK